LWITVDLIIATPSNKFWDFHSGDFSPDTLILYMGTNVGKQFNCLHPEGNVFLQKSQLDYML